MLEIVAPILAGLYVLLCLGSAILVYFAPKSQPTTGPLPRVSVLVAARNEERDLPRCIEALLALDYPTTELDVWLADDHSTDRTGAIVDEAAARNAHVHSLHLSAPVAGEALRAKARVLAEMARRADGEWLFIVDADAVPPPTWIKHMLSGARDDVSLLGGMFLAEPRGLVGLMEAAVGSYVMPFAAAPVTLKGKPIISGVNMAIRRSVYLAEGGLEASGVKVAEDMALERMVTRAKQKCVAFADAETTVWTAPVPSFGHLLSQQRRWLLGGREGDPVMYGFVFFFLGLLCFAFLGFDLVLLTRPKLGATLIGIMALAQTLSAAVLSLRLRRNLIGLAPVLIVYVMVFWPIVYLSCLVFPRVGWHGEGYSVTFGDPKGEA